MADSPAIYKAINVIQSELQKEGITKDQRNVHGKYNFRGIDDVYNVMSPLLAKNGVCVMPRVVDHKIATVNTSTGKPSRLATVLMEFEFVCSDDASSHTVKTAGEAMDSGDKATNKAMSAAYKYAMFQTFAIPTEGDNDADAHTPQIAAKPEPAALVDNPFAGSFAIIKNAEGAKETVDSLIVIAKAFYGDSTVAGLTSLWQENKGIIDHLHERWPDEHARLIKAFTEIKSQIQSKPEQGEQQDG